MDICFEPLNPQQAIIIFPIEKPVLLFNVCDRQLGHIQLRSLIPHHLAPGTVITYTTRHIGSHQYIDTTDTLQVPFELARTDIYFLHMMLQLYAHAIPLGCYIPGIYDILYELTSSHWIEISSLYKNILLYQFITRAGLEVEEYILDHATQNQIHRVGLDRGKTSTLDLKSELLLHDWLYNTLVYHAHTHAVININTIQMWLS